MTSLLCARTPQSVLFAVLLRRMLQMHRSSIIWKDAHLAMEKSAIDMETYTYETLAQEYERRYGPLRWFHDHTQERLALEEQLETYLTRTGDLGTMIRCAEALLEDRWETIPTLLLPSWKDALHFPLLTSRLELAR